MGFFTLAAAGSGFVLIGLCEAFTSSSQNRIQISSPSSPHLNSIQTSVLSSTSNFKTKLNLSSSLSFLAILVLSSLFTLNSSFLFIDAIISSDRMGSAIQLQVVAVSLLFLLYAILGLKVNCSKSFPLPSSLLSLIGLFALVEEFLLFYLQRKDPNGVENRYYDLLLVPIATCFFATVLEMKSPTSNFPKLARGSGLIMQGMWFLQMGFSFYTDLMAHGCSLKEKSKGNYTITCKGHTDYHRARAIATLQFNCHLSLFVVLVVVIYSIVSPRTEGRPESMRYKPLVSEIRSFDNRQFTLDSDDEVAEEISEENNVAKQKEGAIELTVNGHGSQQ